MSTTSLPEPLVPADIDLRDFPFLPVDVARLFASEFHARSTDSEWRAGFTLWLKSWHQVPAGSIPADDVALARLAEFGRDVKGWKKVRDGALHGWVACSDGRLYHPVVTEKARDAWERKQAQRNRTEKARHARLSHAAKISVTETATDPVTASKGQGQGQGQKKKEASTAPSIAVAAGRRGAAELDGIEAQCRAAAGLENEPAPALLDLSPLLALLDEGTPLDHILAVLRAQAARGKRGGSWRYYLPAIREALAANSAGRSANGGGNGHASEPLRDPPPGWPKALVELGVTPEHAGQAWALRHWPSGWGKPPDDPSRPIPAEIMAQWQRREVA